MEDDQPLIYGLELPCRSMCAVDNPEVSEFLVGTQSLTSDNQLHAVYLDTGQVTPTLTKKIYMHPAGEIWHVSSGSNGLITTSYQSTKELPLKYEVCLWRRDDVENDPTGKPLELVSNITQSSLFSTVSWHPSENNTIAIISPSNVSFYDVNSEMVNSMWKENVDSIASRVSTGGFGVGQWYPHSKCDKFAVTFHNSFRVYDLRCQDSSPMQTVDYAHSGTVRDLDFNECQTNSLVTCGDDCKAKIWDFRKLTEPVDVRSDHSHWVWAVKYNRLHDQLLLSCGSDCRVILASLSNDISNTVVKVVEEHEDSVYSVSWSFVDPWTFASLSYDGRLVVSRVPDNVKWKLIDQYQ